MKVKISVPATTANIGPGFDVLGLALQYNNEFLCEVNSTIAEDDWTVSFTELVDKTVSAKMRTSLLQSPDNLVLKSYKEVFKQKGIEPLPVRIQAKIGIPLSRGLGSSSTAILAGMTLANEALRKLYENPFSNYDIFNMACKMEGHPDNIAPALYGGLVLSMAERSVDSNAIRTINSTDAEQKADPKTKADVTQYHALRIPVNAPVKLGGIVPHTSLATSEARLVIQQTQPLSVVSFQSSRTAALTHLLAKQTWDEQDKKLFTIALDDKIHQDPRSALIPGMKETLTAWKKMGALGAYLSGAGTTLIGFWELDADIENLGLRDPFLITNAGATEIFPTIDSFGLTITYV
ncbi:MAG: homoserine kinase [Leptospirales bacterium]